MRHVINVVTRLQDNGDGGYTMYMYNNNEELLEDHPKGQMFDSTRPDGQKFYKRVLTEEEKQDILNEDDPYKNGYIGQETIEIEVMEDGSVRLAKPMCLGVGQ